MKISKSLLKKIRNGAIVLSISFTAFFSFGFVDSYFELSKNLDIFATLLRELNTYYVDEIKPGDLIKKGIDEMLNTLDPYTEFYAETDIEDYKMMVTGQYGGIGSLIRQKGDYVMIGEPYEGFPAQKAGLMAGDVITEIDGKSIKGKTTADVSKLLKGQAGTAVKVLVERESEKKPFEVSLTREEIKIKNVPYYGVIGDGTVGYIKLTGFTENAAKEVKDAFTQLKEKNHIKSLVFDLRDNGGGLLKESVDIVNTFVGKDQPIVEQKGKVKEMNRTHKTQFAPVDTTMPIAVLVNKNSASASEIVTGSLQDLDRAVVVGQRSFGKGLVQQTVQLSYGTQMKVTTAKYYTPSGRCIQELDYFHKNKAGKAEHIPDSLIREFKTKNGRSVYDGSGIFPDVKTEPRQYALITGTILSKNYVFDYATKYRLAHNTLSSSKDFSLTEKEYSDFVNYLSDKTYEYTTKSEKSLDELKKNAESEKYFENIKTDYDNLKEKIKSNKKEDLAKYKPEIKDFLEEEIASRYYYQHGRLESSLRDDKELKEAIRVLNDQELYKSILNGKGQYKVIGKPGDAQAKANTTDDEGEDLLAPDDNIKKDSLKVVPPHNKKKGG
ncbi:MAG: PDZ domain-containing protein [Bacteroidetes bacterium]|nr:PDZ domain-containing protein [Bacteroidota bacterium]